ncbi:MarR family transcriptional regulator [Fluoribacter dumoffii]|uniref:MarR family winged helix-turn-helix transcriptional regulator n=1 Tax=Fluoribacter dumoffii TaxID=463 RepID=UPI002242E43F|nr:MarR family transcriptional regulator [Fluoribacter dumoffii]MCW8418519.1 MarR family transcriptional regulator [Fluoribacter dumoffii]MCW8453639.1 MarR family transcriptional regulator [Fluoribacter dumoffii]MCW8459143.1 MarR family transcriptional regulator [Fluoribacter dumoffii]MCW8482502.1 MarR family transcriptional regulator [Fluoribacter dumoffii]
MSDLQKRIGEATDQLEHGSKDIILALRNIMQQMDYHSRRLNKLYGLTVPQVICLYEIYEQGIMTISSLSKRVYLSMSTLVGVIDRLEEKNFVSRTRDIKDRRNIYIDITPKGKEFVQEAPYLLHNRLNENFKNVTKEEQNIISNALHLLVNFLREI